ncbi:MAG: ABC transporter ATP-binding protein, partial [bacterium]
AGDRVLNILEAEPDVRDLPGAVAAPALNGAIRFENVTFGYEPGHTVLHEIDFEVRPGERIALVGPSGHGKSTLVNLIMRLYDPVRGRVVIDGHDLREFTLSSLRAQTSMVFQDTMLFGATVSDNIAYGSPDASSQEIEMAARLANAHEFIQSLPQGYDSELGERGVTLSNGQRQRIAIARAAVRRASILILDEPTTGLDEENKQEVVEALKRLSQDHTTFLIVHDLEIVSDADQILHLENGRIRERGTHEELMRANGRYAAMFRLRSIGHEYNGRKEKTNVVLS